MNKSKKIRRPTPLGNGGGSEPVLTAKPSTGQEATVFDYTYVKKDLARIGMLAGMFIVVLVALSFFIK
jgi:hypothetical protein